MQQYNHVWLSFSYCFSPNGSISVVDISTVSTTLTADIKFADSFVAFETFTIFKKCFRFCFFFVFFFVTTIYFLHFKSSFFHEDFY